MIWWGEFTTFELAVDAAEVASSDWLKRHGRSSMLRGSCEALPTTSKQQHCGHIYTTSLSNRALSPYLNKTQYYRFNSGRNNYSRRSALSRLRIGASKHIHTTTMALNAYLNSTYNLAQPSFIC